MLYRAALCEYSNVKNRITSRRKTDAALPAVANEENESRRSAEEAMRQ